MTLAQILNLIKHGGSVFVPCLDVEGVKKRAEIVAIGERVRLKATVGIHGGMLGVMLTNIASGKKQPAASALPESDPEQPASH